MARRDVSMQWLVLGRQWSAVLVAHFAFLHRALPTDDYSCARLKANQQYTVNNVISLSKIHDRDWSPHASRDMYK